MSFPAFMRQQSRRAVALSAIVLGLTIFGCTDEKSPQPAPPPPSTPSPETVACKVPRPQMCMMIYMPVCGQTKDGAWNSYPNSCQACTHAEVARYKPGACAT